MPNFRSRLLIVFPLSSYSSRNLTESRNSFEDSRSNKRYLFQFVKNSHQIFENSDKISNSEQISTQQRNRLNGDRLSKHILLQSCDSVFFHVINVLISFLEYIFFCLKNCEIIFTLFG